MMRLGFAGSTRRLRTLGIGLVAGMLLAVSSPPILDAQSRGRIGGGGGGGFSGGGGGRSFGGGGSGFSGGGSRSFGGGGSSSGAPRSSGGAVRSAPSTSTGRSFSSPGMSSGGTRSVAPRSSMAPGSSSGSTYRSSPSYRSLAPSTYRATPARDRRPGSRHHQFRAGFPPDRRPRARPRLFLPRLPGAPPRRRGAASRIDPRTGAPSRMAGEHRRAAAQSRAAASAPRPAALPGISARPRWARRRPRPPGRAFSEARYHQPREGSCRPGPLRPCRQAGQVSRHPRARRGDPARSRARAPLLREAPSRPAHWEPQAAPVSTREARGTPPASPPRAPRPQRDSAGD